MWRNSGPHICYHIWGQVKVRGMVKVKVASMSDWVGTELLQQAEASTSTLEVSCSLCTKMITWSIEDYNVSQNVSHDEEVNSIVQLCYMSDCRWHNAVSVWRHICYISTSSSPKIGFLVMPAVTVVTAAVKMCPVVWDIYCFWMCYAWPRFQSLASRSTLSLLLLTAVMNKAVSCIGEHCNLCVLSESCCDVLPNTVQC